MIYPVKYFNPNAIKKLAIGLTILFRIFEKMFFDIMLK